MPMDINLHKRLQAIVHYSKVFVLDYAFSTWLAESGVVIEVQSRLNMVSIEWINDEEGLRPARVPGDGGPVYLMALWESVVAHVAKKADIYLRGRQGRAIFEL
jgi:hypothetical protein